MPKDILSNAPLRLPHPDQQLLACWKDIARFFGKGVRTVQRWEKNLGMPVHRPGNDRSVVFADPEELRRWALGAQNDAGNSSETSSSYSSAS